MTSANLIQAIAAALALPPEARVDARVAKKLLTEHGAPTPADKRAIQDGIDELQWLSVCKPGTIGVPPYSDDDREYLEIAIIACDFRPGAKAARLIELIHRAIPYPVVLITLEAERGSVSLAHKRRSQGEIGKFVIDRVVTVGDIADPLGPSELAFLRSLALADQPRQNLFALYEGWLACVEALNAARLAGAFSTTNDAAKIELRRTALDVLSRVSREITGLRAKANREKQMSRRVDLNMQIQKLEADAASHKKNL